ncbi:MAG: NUDIX hydrolase [Candidatus Omnitrophica bacterium]|nr:NUDIX hydrolase [Candidatus Omnitrophota bacterium]
MRTSIKLLKRSIIYQGPIVRLIKEELMVGGKRITRETIQHPGAVVIVPLLPRNRVILVRQYRRSVNQWLLELPAGTLHPGEKPALCARRELEEETGWRAKRLRRLCCFYAAPGAMNERMTLFLAQDLIPGHSNLDHDEFLKVIVLPLKEALRKIQTGTIRDAKTLIGLWWAQQVLG